MLVQETIAQTNRQPGAESPLPTVLRESGKVRSLAKNQVEERDERPSQVQPIEPEEQPVTERSSRARLSLDPEQRRVFVEIVDPKTGDVITRFPPEQIADHIDSVLERTGQGTNLEESGLIVDESV